MSLAALLDAWASQPRRMCYHGHPTRTPEPGQRLLPCGCVLETATRAALEAEGLASIETDRREADE